VQFCELPSSTKCVKKSPQLNIRLDPEIRKILDEIEERTGVPDHAVVKALLAALRVHYAEHGSITLPIRINGTALRPKHRADRDK